MKITCIAVAIFLISSYAVILFDSDVSEAAIGPLGYSLNGNQELFSDPTRPIVYAADTDGDTVHVFNATTGEEMWNVTVGASPLSIDISADGRYMYVAVSGYNVTIVDLQTRSVSNTIALAFSPISVRIGLSGRLYLTQSGGALDVVRESSGTLIEEIGGIGSCVLEMSPNKTTLMVLQLGSSPTPLYKYSCAGTSLVLLDQDNHDLGPNARQMAIDWANETLYLVCGSPYGVQVVSLSTLDLLGFMPATSYPGGVALSSDHTTVLCTTYSGPDELWAFSTSNWSLVAKYKFREWAAGDDPVNFHAITAPLTTGCVIAVGDPVLFVNLSRPALFPGFPRAGEGVGYDYFGNISANIFVGIPACQFTSQVMMLDGVTVVSHIRNPYMLGELPSPITRGGNHTLYASISWTGGSTEVNWTFTTSETEHIVSETPAKDSVLNYVPENITIVLDLGYPIRQWAGGSIVLNNFYVPWILENGTINLHTYGLTMPGKNIVSLHISFSHVDYMTLVYSDLYEDLEFSIIDVPTTPSTTGLGWHNVSEASLMLPTSWIIRDNVTVGLTKFATQALGPVTDKARASISLQTGIDLNFTTDAQYLDSFPDEFVDQMGGVNHTVYIVEGPRTEQVSGHPAMVFAVRWTEQPIVQKLMVVADVDSGRYWLLIMTVDQSLYFRENPMLEGVISSFSVPEGGHDGSLDEAPLVLKVALGIALGALLAVLVGMVVVALNVWPRRKTPPGA